MCLGATALPLKIICPSRDQTEASYQGVRAMSSMPPAPPVGAGANPSKIKIGSRVWPGAPANRGHRSQPKIKNRMVVYLELIKTYIK